MKEHMEVPIDTSNMSEQELQFHYFKMHDSDGNNKLDGCELVKSLIHWHGMAGTICNVMPNRVIHHLESYVLLQSIFRKFLGFWADTVAS